MKISNFKLKPVFLILVLLIICLYFITRLTNLTSIPVFADEAIYIRWSQIMRAESTLRFLPLSDGKQPFFMWLTIPFLKIFSDPLVAGRMVSVLAGLGSMVGVGVLSFFLFRKKEISLFVAIFYLISPFTFFFDRMALADGLLSFFGIWFLVFSALLINSPRLDVSMIAGIILGLALLTKSPAIFFAIMLPLTLFLLNIESKCHCERSVATPNENKINFSINWRLVMRLIKIFGLWTIVYLFGFTIYNILRLGPEFHMIAIRNKDYIYSFSEILKHPLNPLIGNIKDAVNWYWVLLTPASFLLGALGIGFLFKKDYKKAIFLLFCWLGPLSAQSAVAKVYTSRYILYSVPFLLIFTGYIVEKIFISLKSKIITTLILFAIFVFPVVQIFLLIYTPQKAWLPRNDRSGYLEMWTAGFGIKETSEYLKEIAKKEKVLVGTEGYFGTLPDGLQVYLEKVPNITTIGVGYPVKEVPKKLSDGLNDNRVFLLINDTRYECVNCPLKLVEKFPKAENPQTKKTENLLLFELIKN